MIQVPVSSNYPEWSKVFQKYVEVSGLTMAQAIDKKALDCAFLLLKNTPRGSKDTIKALPGKLGKIWYGYVVNRIKTGLLTVRRNVVAARSSKGSQRLLKQLDKAASSGQFSRQNVSLASRLLLSKRTRAIGFLASGWLPSIQKLSEVVESSRGKPSTPKQFGTPKGSCQTVDSRSDQQTVLMENSTAEYAGSQKAYAILEKSSEAVLAFQAADMLKYVERKQQEVINRFIG